MSRRILVVGGTGRTGRRIVAGLIEAGCTPVVLSPSATPDGVPAGAVALAGDVLDPEVIDRGMTGADAVVTALSIPREGRSPFAKVTGPIDLHSRSIRGILDAMERHEVRRIVKISAQGVGDSAPRAGVGLRALVRFSSLKPVFEDHATADATLAAAAVDYTIVRPPILEDGDPEGWIRADEGLLTGTFTRMRTGDVAKLRGHGPVRSPVVRPGADPRAGLIGP